jgi:hypothetical protein
LIAHKCFLLMLFFIKKNAKVAFRNFKREFLGKIK